MRGVDARSCARIKLICPRAPAHMAAARGVRVERNLYLGIFFVIILDNKTDLSLKVHWS